jgi:hypothetical protein
MVIVFLSFYFSFSGYTVNALIKGSNILLNTSVNNGLALKKIMAIRIKANIIVMVIRLSILCNGMLYPFFLKVPV